ncbi:tRNA (adenosine(37)-N6)-threonylcarbamoyltransferase complex ATPase subunit type 1 TsaE [Rhodobacteraceae bacterium]|nr:tRNA (adenosine(37)-N6)-threonylcarbamoyltransferase complex ATPase subunit type 1 TsaE [Paracoccaceae bacterium]
MGFSATTFLADSNETDRFGAELAALIQAGDTILLEGEIGAGKSHLARAVIQSLLQTSGLPSVEVPSPTYTLVQTYDLTDTVIWHADLYRLADGSETLELGLDDAFGVDIVLIEWPDRLDQTVEGALKIALETAGTGRTMQVTSASDRWQVLSNRLACADA